MSSLRGELITETFPFDGGRQITAYLPPDPPDAVVFAADGGWHTEGLANAIKGSEERATMIVGVHGLNDDDGRLQEYVQAFGGERFEAYERFSVEGRTRRLVLVRREPPRGTGRRCQGRSPR